MKKILIVEDDEVTAREIIAALADHGRDAIAVSSAKEALIKAVTEQYDALILDRMLSGDMDGLALLRALRAIGIDVPVLVLSALSEVDERVRGLKAGGDDYLTKPFEFLELTARLDALIRRQSTPQLQTVLRAGSVEIDLLAQNVTRAGQLVELLPREYRLLEYLMRHAGQVVTRTMLFEEVWHYHYGQPTNAIDVHIGKLRRKLDRADLPPVIETVRGSGYLLRASD